MKSGHDERLTTSFGFGRCECATNSYDTINDKPKQKGQTREITLRCVGIGEEKNNNFQDAVKSSSGCYGFTYSLSLIQLFFVRCVQGRMKWLKKLHFVANRRHGRRLPARNAGREYVRFDGSQCGGGGIFGVCMCLFVYLCVPSASLCNA